jgi:hypothetical protein
MQNGKGLDAKTHQTNQDVLTSLVKRIQACPDVANVLFKVNTSPQMLAGHWHEMVVRWENQQVPLLSV